MYRHPLSHYFLNLLTLSHHTDLALFGSDCAHPVITIIYIDLYLIKKKLVANFWSCGLVYVFDWGCQLRSPTLSLITSTANKRSSTKSATSLMRNPPFLSPPPVSMALISSTPTQHQSVLVQAPLVTQLWKLNSTAHVFITANNGNQDGNHQGTTLSTWKTPTSANGSSLFALCWWKTEIKHRRS